MEGRMFEKNRVEALDYIRRLIHYFKDDPKSIDKIRKLAKASVVNILYLVSLKKEKNELP